MAGLTGLTELVGLVGLPVLTGWSSVTVLADQPAKFDETSLMEKIFAF